jgi:hypothetical protein
MNQKAQIKFLIYCIGLTKGENPPVSFGELTKKEWTAILKKARLHSITPLLYHHLKQHKIQIPTNVLKQLEQAYLRSSLRNTHIYYELSRILTGAENKNIPIIVLKGAVLAGSVYPSIALRPMKDLDLLVKIEDVYKVHELLIQLGWESEYSEELIEHHLKLNYSLRYKKSGILIDLHIKVPEISAINPWSNATSVTINSTKMLVMGTDDLFLHLCIHLYEHTRIELFAELIKFYDIVLLIRKHKINWDYVVQNAYTNQCENIMYHILDFVRSEFGEDIPIDVLEKLKSDKFTIQISKGLHNTPQYITDTFKPIKGIIMAIYSRRFDPKNITISDVIKEIFRGIFPDKNWMLERYSPKRSWLFFIYYPVYIVTGAKNLLKTIFKQISKN